MRPIEAIPGLFMLVVAAALIFGTAGLSFWDGPTPGARFFPALLAAVGTIVALALLWAQARGIETVETDFPARPGALRVAGTALALAALAAGAPLVGFVPALALFVAVVLLGVLRQGPLPSLATAAIVAGFVHVVFVRWLAVPLPAPLGL
jgi:hypothetical protein